MTNRPAQSHVHSVPIAHIWWNLSQPPQSNARNRCPNRASVTAHGPPAGADECYLYPGDGVRQSRTAAGQPPIYRLAVVIADTRARAAARRQLEDPTRRRALFQTGM